MGFDNCILIAFTKVSILDMEDINAAFSLKVSSEKLSYERFLFYTLEK